MLNQRSVKGYFVGGGGALIGIVGGGNFVPPLTASSFRTARSSISIDCGLR